VVPCSFLMTLRFWPLAFGSSLFAFSLSRLQLL
jgi:hypothetical protein